MRNLTSRLLLQQGNLYKLQQLILHGISRSSRPDVFCKKAALKTYEEFTGKHLCWNLQVCNFIKKRLEHWCFL